MLLQSLRLFMQAKKSTGTKDVNVFANLFNLLFKGDNSIYIIGCIAGWFAYKEFGKGKTGKAFMIIGIGFVLWFVFNNIETIFGIFNGWGDKVIKGS